MRPMYRLIIIIGVLLIVGSLPARGQQFQLNGLEIYNPQTHNPAFIGSKKTAQVDLLGYKNYIKEGIWAGAMTSLPKYHSSVGLFYAQGSYPGSIDFNNQQVAYAYTHSFSEDLHARGGLVFSRGQSEYLFTAFDPDREGIKERRSGSVGLGTVFEYKKLRAGFSTLLPLYVKKDVWISENSTDTRKDDQRFTSLHFLADYSLGKPKRTTFKPIIGLDFYMNNRTTDNQLMGYLGGKLEIRNLVGIGFTMGNLVSFSTSLNIMDRVSLIMGIYAAEHELFDAIHRASYAINFGDFEMIGQIRINL